MTVPPRWRNPTAALFVLGCYVLILHAGYQFKPLSGKVLFKKGKRVKVRDKLRKRRIAQGASGIVKEMLLDMGVLKTRKQKRKLAKTAALKKPEKKKGMKIQPDGRSRGEMRRERAERHRLRLMDEKPETGGRPYVKNRNGVFDPVKRRERRRKLRERRKRRKTGEPSPWVLNTTFFNVQFGPGRLGVRISGQKLTRVSKGFQAYRLGLKPKMRFVAVNGTKARTHELLSKLLNRCKAANASYVVTVMRRTLVPRITEQQRALEERQRNKETLEFLRSRGLRPDPKLLGHIMEQGPSDDQSVIEEEEGGEAEEEKKCAKEGGEERKIGTK
mmetsp:Transcript_45365/g.75644  ORF Transcript_45365/g.75644 Transcript_45365/m.75644 type:complete len:330 (-) Transcript_45365:35-1024(-)